MYDLVFIVEKNNTQNKRKMSSKVMGEFGVDRTKFHALVLFLFFIDLYNIIDRRLGFLSCPGVERIEDGERKNWMKVRGKL